MLVLQVEAAQTLLLCRPKASETVVADLLQRGYVLLLVFNASFVLAWPLNMLHAGMVFLHVKTEASRQSLLAMVQSEYSKPSTQSRIQFRTFDWSTRLEMCASTSTPALFSICRPAHVWTEPLYREVLKTVEMYFDFVYLVEDAL